MIDVKIEGLDEFYRCDGADVYITDNFDGLPQVSKDVLEQQLIDATERGFQRNSGDDNKSDIGNHLRGGDLIVMFHEGVAEGFALRKRFPDLGAVYLGGAVKTNLLPSGIVEEMTMRYIDIYGCRRVITRTQNDRVLDYMIDLCDDVTPIYRSAQERDYKLLSGVGLINDETNISDDLILRGVYGCPLVPVERRRRSKNPLVTRQTDKLDYCAGDAFCVVGYK